MITTEAEIIDKISEAFYLILNGKEPAPIQLPPDHPDNEIKQAIDYINKFVNEYNAFSGFMQSLARGELDFTSTKSKMQIVQCYKNHRSSLKHLTWKTQQIAKGDFSQKVDFLGDFSTAFNDMTLQLKNAFDELEIRNKDLKSANDIITSEKRKSENLLLNVLPAKVVEELKHKGKTEPEQFDNVSVYFSDIVSFTTHSSKINPSLLISGLNAMFTAFDEIMEKHQCERIKTIGDAYLAVCGMPEPNEDHAKNMVDAAIEIRDYLLNREKNKIQWKIRIGIHSGSVVGGVVGVKKYIYDVFGDTINTASRMECNSEPMHINISDTTYELIKNEYAFIERAPIDVKGKGKMKMYFVQSKSDTVPVPQITEKRKSPRINISTEMIIDVGSERFHCETIDLSPEGGALLVAKNNNKENITLSSIGKRIMITPSSHNETRYSGEIVRCFKRNGNLYFGIRYQNSKSNIIKAEETKRLLNPPEIDASDSIKRKHEMSDKKNDLLNDHQDVRKLISSYHRFIPHQMLKMLGKKSILDVSLGDQIEKNVTVLFMDIRDFTTLSESLTPQENIDFINSFLSQMEPLISAHGGIIDKFIGDAIMAIFPTSANDALNCSMLMLKQLENYNEGRTRAGYDHINIGIGLNTGMAILGTIGGINRMEGTVISNAVSLAARLESLTKKYGVQLLISEHTYNSLDENRKQNIRFIDRVLVKGKERPQSVYEVFEGDDQETKQRKNDSRLTFEEGMANYHYKQIKAAKSLLQKCIDSNQNDKPAQIYLERCNNFEKAGLHEGTKELHEQLEWNSTFELGHEIIDKQHYELVTSSINLINAIEAEKEKSEILLIVSTLANQAAEHFNTEENYMVEAGYPFLGQQKEQHHKFLLLNKTIQQQIDDSSLSKVYLMFQIRIFLIDWLMNHTSKEDKHFGKFLKCKR